MDNPTYEEGINVAPPVMEVHHEEDIQLQNPLYFDVGPHQHNISYMYPQTKTNSMCEGVYSDCEAVGETYYENPHNSNNDLFNEKEFNSELKGGIATAFPYEVPQALVNADNDNCYSAVGPTDYATLEPHVPQTKQQLPPDNDQYSQLHH